MSLLAARAETSRRRTAQRNATSRTLISKAQLNRPTSKLVYRIVLILVVVVFTLVFIGPLYFLFTDGLKAERNAVSKQVGEAIRGGASPDGPE